MTLTDDEKRIRNNRQVKLCRLRKKYPDLYAKECALCHTKEGVKSKYCIPCRKIASTPLWKRTPKVMVCKTCGVPTEGKKRYCEPHRIEAAKVSRQAISARWNEKTRAMRPPRAAKECHNCHRVSTEVRMTYCPGCREEAHRQKQKEKYRRQKRHWAVEVHPVLKHPRIERAPKPIKEKKVRPPKEVKIRVAPVAVVRIRAGFCRRCEGRLKTGEEGTCAWCVKETLEVTRIQ